MQNTTIWIMGSLAGVAIGAVFGYLTGNINGAMAGLLAPIIPFIMVVQIITYAKTHGFLLLYKKLEDDEKYSWIPNKMNKLYLFILNNKYKGIIYKKGLGVFEDKGTEFNFGNQRMTFCMPESGHGLDIKTEQYFSILQREDKLEEWDDCIKVYLGEIGYKSFAEKFRQNPKPDILDINAELNYLILQKPADPLSKLVFGETIDFSNRCKHLKYTYDPISGENAIEREKLIAHEEALDYKPVDKNISRAKAIVMILMGLMIFLLVISTQWENIRNLLGV